MAYMHQIRFRQAGLCSGPPLSGLIVVSQKVINFFIENLKEQNAEPARTRFKFK